jgi:phospholipase A-2-activating protein
MYHQEPVYVEETFKYLTQAVANTSKITAPRLTAKHIDTVSSMMERWPSGSRFPGAFL